MQIEELLKFKKIKHFKTNKKIIVFWKDKPEEFKIQKTTH